MNVLVVEDEPIVALDLKFMVEDMGHVVVGTCGSVREGLAIAETHGPDIALLDVHLLDGEVFPLADVLHGEGRGLVFHSGHAEFDDIAARYPDARFCPKPTSFRELQRCLDAFRPSSGIKHQETASAALR